MPEPAVAPSLTAEEVARRIAVRRRHRLRLLGVALLVYGLAGIVIFIVLAVGVTRPLQRAQRLSASVEQQRLALIDSLDQAESTIRQMSVGVDGMTASLEQARTATDRAATISQGLANSMYSLRDAMSISIFGAQPLIGLAGGFDQSAQNIEILGGDISAIGTALQANADDVATTAENLRDLATSVGALTDAVREGPGVAISASTLDAVRLALFAVAAWMMLLAVGCSATGLYLLAISRRPAGA